MIKKKKENFTVSQFGIKLDPKDYTWDSYGRIFFSERANLVLDFADVDNCTIKVSSNCVVFCGSGCTITSGDFCSFTTNKNCTFTTGSSCNFKTGDCCLFKTGDFCNFVTYNHCVFHTGTDCSFDTEGNCKFTSGERCSFTTKEHSQIRCGKESVVIRRDIFQIFQPEQGKIIKLNGLKIPGFTVSLPPREDLLKFANEKITKMSDEELIKTFGFK